MALPSPRVHASLCRSVTAGSCLSDQAIGLTTAVGLLALRLLLLLLLLHGPHLMDK
jgi:hypothetical protein